MPPQPPFSPASAPVAEPMTSAEPHAESFLKAFVGDKCVHSDRFQPCCISLAYPLKHSPYFQAGFGLMVSI